MNDDRERWILYLDTTCQAGRWPWGRKSWAALTAADIARLPGTVDDFGDCSPADGNVDMCHVPPDLPRRTPVCATRLAVCHDAKFLYVFQVHVRPTRPIPELADVEREDFSLAIQLGGHQRGLYFGMNENGEHIGCVQVWDPDLQPPTAAEDYPWTLLQKRAGVGPANSAAGILSAKEYGARLIRGTGVLTAAWRLPRALLASGFDGNRLRLSSARFCHRTGETVCWGSAIMWSPRVDRMGTVELVGAVAPPRLPQLRRVDVVYDFARERGEFEALWSGPASAAALKPFRVGAYADFVNKYTVALNGREVTAPLAPVARDAFDVPDGWNRLEYLSAFGPARVISFEKVSSQRVVVPAFVRPAALPTAAAIRRDFARWHRRHDRRYHPPGAWDKAPDETCLCHGGVFHMLPYALACLHLDRRDVYVRRVRETCERMLAAQHAEGWYPCGCASDRLQRKPARFEGGAFANGSVGEAVLLGHRVLRDPRLLASARRAAAAYRWYPWEKNQNYCAFALWHLAELCEQEPTAKSLKRAVYYARHFASRDIGLLGAQDGHNFYTGYADITLKGLARLYRILPASHPFRPVLRRRILRFANQTLARLQPDGLSAGRNRRYLGYRHLSPGLFEVARALPETRPALKPVLALMYRTAQRLSAKEQRDDESIGAVLALMARYRQGTSRLLAAGRRARRRN